MEGKKDFQFPKNFLWGTATAAYQIEGAVDVDGRKPSVWDTFCERTGAIKDASSGRDACRHYVHWEKDLDLLKSLGLNSYRFSIAWPRMIPDGRGALNPKGLAFYERLIDGMLKRGIKPNATLYHWDLPQSLEDKGGWRNRDTALAYGDYAAAVLKRFGDRLELVATHNEPQVFVWLGYFTGEHAPGRKEGVRDIMQIIHHVLLAHGLGIQAARAQSPKLKAGIVLAPTPVWPASSSPEDLAASERHWEDSNDWWVLPLLKGHYPEEAWKRRGGEVPKIGPRDMETICQKMDFLGLNYYSPARTQFENSAQGYKILPRPEDAIPADMPGWEDFPQALERLLLKFSKRYPKIPYYLTENGISISADSVGEDGKVHDAKRIRFIEGHLIHAKRAMDAGVDLRGYFVWSLLDNFEWGHGFTQRFGLYHTDYASYQRTPKESAHWYREVAARSIVSAEERPIDPLTRLGTD